MLAISDDALTTGFGIVVASALAIVGAALLFYRPRRGVRRVLGCLLIVGGAVTAFAYNVVPGLHIPPDARDRASCVDWGYYQWDVIAHEWTCHDNWLIPGVHGV